MPYSASSHISELEASARQLRERSVAHPQLGAAGFAEAEEQKNRYCDFLIRLLESAAPNADALNETILRRHLDAAARGMAALAEVCKRIDVTVSGEGLHKPEFPGQRQKILNSMRSATEDNTVALEPLDQLLNVRKLTDVLGNASRLAELTGDATVGVDQLQSRLSEADALMEKLRSGSAAQGVIARGKAFQRLRASHAKRERRWLGWFVLATILEFAAVLWVLYETRVAAPATNGVTGNGDAGRAVLTFAINDVFRHLLVLSLPALLMKVTLHRFGLERNLRIIYDHRQTVLDQYWSFEAAIGDTIDAAAAKNKFRIEIVKYIFSDPLTGYIGNESDRGITVNPVMQLVERAGMSREAT